MAKRLIKSGCHLGSVVGWYIRLKMEIVEGERADLGVNVRHPIVTNGILCMRGGDALSPNDFGRTCLLLRHCIPYVLLSVVSGCQYHKIHSIRTPGKLSLGSV